MSGDISAACLQPSSLLMFCLWSEPRHSSDMLKLVFQEAVSQVCKLNLEQGDCGSAKLTLSLESPEFIHTTTFGST